MGAAAGTGRVTVRTVTRRSGYRIIRRVRLHRPPGLWQRLWETVWGAAPTGTGPDRLTRLRTLQAEHLRGGCGVGYGGRP